MTAATIAFQRAPLPAITSARVPAIAPASPADGHRLGGGSLLAGFVGGIVLVVGLLAACVAVGAAGLVPALVALLAATGGIAWTMSRLLEDAGA